MKNNQWHIPITLVLIFMGIFLSVQFQNQTRLASDLTSLRSENLISMVRDLSVKRQVLGLEIMDLEQKLQTQLDSFSNKNNLTTSLNSELEKVSIITGSSALKGSGLSIIITQNMPILYVDLINMVNELWAAGAEAIAINDVRITSHAVIFYAQDEFSMFITVNNNRLSYPIEIKALGDPNSLEKGLTLPGGIMDNLALFRAYPILKKVPSLSLPAVQDPFDHYFMYEYKPPAPDPLNTPTENR